MSKILSCTRTIFASIVLGGVAVILYCSVIATNATASTENETCCCADATAPASPCSCVKCPCNCGCDDHE